MFKKKSLYFILLIVIMIILFLFMIYKKGNESREYYTYKNNLISECVLENKTLPNPKDVCTASFQLGKLKSK